MEMVVEILNLPHDSVEFIDGDYSGHYVRTPYAYEQKTVRRYIPSKHIDFVQGLLQTMSDIDNV
jgi:UDP-glucose 4-epimerase